MAMAAPQNLGDLFARFLPSGSGSESNNDENRANDGGFLSGIADNLPSAEDGIKFLAAGGKTVADGIR